MLLDSASRCSTAALSRDLLRDVSEDVWPGRRDGEGLEWSEVESLLHGLALWGKVMIMFIPTNKEYFYTITDELKFWYLKKNYFSGKTSHLGWMQEIKTSRDAFGQ